MTSSRRTGASAPPSRSATTQVVEKSVAEPSSWLKISARPSGATTEMSSAERSRIRWRRSLAAMSSAWRTGPSAATRPVAERAAGEVEEHRLEVRRDEVDAADARAGGLGRVEQPRQHAVGIGDEDLELVALRRRRS